MDSFVRKYGRYVPFALTIIIIFCCALFLKDHEFSEILSYCPDNLWLAAFVILGFYGIPACSYFCVRGCNISVLGGHFVERNRTIGLLYCSLSCGKNIGWRYHACY